MERLIGSIRRERVDHTVVSGAQHLRQLLKYHASYYNEARTNLSLNQDAPLSRPAQAIGRIFPNRSSADCTTGIEQSAALV